MKSTQPLAVAPGAGKKVSVIGNPITIKMHGRDTGGALCLIELTDAPGGGPPPHIHEREDETFYVVEGEYEFVCDGKSFPLKKGATIFAPRGLVHSYKNIGATPAKLLMMITPAGFEEFFEEVGAMSAEQQEIPKVIAIGKKYGLEFLPPPNS
jgi:mannose-6-phosphate isomerase-like protein (cupin superfamily)